MYRLVHVHVHVRVHCVCTHLYQMSLDTCMYVLKLSATFTDLHVHVCNRYTHVHVYTFVHCMYTIMRSTVAKVLLLSAPMPMNSTCSSSVVSATD